MNPLIFAQLGAFLLRHWKAVVIALAIAYCTYWQHKAGVLADKLQASAVARAAAIQIWKGELDSLTSQLADAKAAQVKAKAETAAAEREAAKKLALERNKWRRIYSSKPINRAWADSPVPADILNGLRPQP